MKLRVTPPRLVKEPPSSALPSGWTSSASTRPLVSGLKSESRVPLRLIRARPRRVVGAFAKLGRSWVKLPASRIEPSDCSAMANTV